MDQRLASGTKLTSTSGVTYTVNTLLGEGGQGEVYKVSSNGKEYALKWYFKASATEMQRKILENLIAQGAPSPAFLWPLDMVLAPKEGLFGYIMPLRPAQYKSLVALMKRQITPSFKTMCRTAYNTAEAFSKLHIRGYSYRDISFGNLFFDPSTGDVRICDNDNVAPRGVDCGVNGTPRFMAPEIVRGEAKPSQETDRFSLAVLLFYALMIAHPLDGRKEYNIHCLDVPAMNKLYGEEPVFIFDPQNTSNRPVPGYHDSAIVYWPIYPQALRDLFTKTFTDGMFAPAKRATDTEWLNVLGDMLEGIGQCPQCGAEVFYDATQQSAQCWHCKQKVPMPARLVMGKHKILLRPDTKIYSHYANDNYDMNTVIGTLKQNPNTKQWGISNSSDKNWDYITADGSRIPVAPGRTAAIAQDAMIDFGSVKGKFETSR